MMNIERAIKLSDEWVIILPDDDTPNQLVTKVRTPDTEKTNLQGFYNDYKKLYDLVKDMDENGGAILSLEYTAGDLMYHCSEEILTRERTIYNNVKTTYKSFLHALEDACGIESTYTEWESN